MTAAFITPPFDPHHGGDALTSLPSAVPSGSLRQKTQLEAGILLHPRHDSIIF